MGARAFGLLASLESGFGLGSRDKVYLRTIVVEVTSSAVLLTRKVTACMVFLVQAIIVHGGPFFTIHPSNHPCHVAGSVQARS